MLKKIEFAPGVNKESTQFAADGYWYDSDKVRFKKGRPEKIGGWSELSSNTYLGVSRSMHNWSSRTLDDYMAIGTNVKAYVEIGGTYYDITPTRYTTQIELGEDLDTTEPGIEVSTDDISASSVIRVDNEYMLVTGGHGTTTLTVTRSVFGTTAATHDDEAAVYEVKLSANPIGIADGSDTVLIYDESHGAYEGDYITFLHMATDPAAGIIRTDFLTGYNESTSTQGFEITNILGADHYEILVGATGSTGASNTLSDTLLANDTDDVDLTDATGFVQYDIVKIDDEYIQLGSKSSDAFSGSSRGQFGSTMAEHSSGTTVALVKTTAKGAGTATFAGGNTYILYDIHAAQVSYAGASGWGSGGWTGRPETYVNSKLSAGINDIVTAIPFGSSAFGSSGSILVDNETISYAANNGSQVSGGARGVVGTAVSHSLNATVYDITSTWFGWGESATSVTELALWSLDNSGSNLVLAQKNGVPCLWDSSSSTTGSIPMKLTASTGADNDGIIIGEAVPMSSLGIAIDNAHGQVPDAVGILKAYPNQNFVIAFGVSTVLGVFDPMLVRWTGRGLLGSWANNSELSVAGGQPLQIGSKIIGACRAKRELLIWTDEAIYSATPTYDEYVFSWSIIARGVSILAQNAYVIAGDVVYWMSDRNFYSYNGRVEVLPCTVLQYVYSDLNYSQREKIFAARNSEFTEVTFFYPSSLSDDIDRYVIYNYTEGTWAVGSMSRTAWSDSGIRQKPEAAFVSDVDASVSRTYIHESGYNDVNDPMDAYIESGYVDLDDGEYVTFLSRFIPDIRFYQGSAINVDIRTKEFPNSPSSLSSYDDVRSSTLYKNIRLRARQMAVKFSSDDASTGWQIGDFRFEIKPDGRR